MTGAPGVVVKTRGQGLGDRLVNQGDGENERRLVRTAGALLETPDLQETVNGIETKIGMKMRRSGSLTGREISIEMIVSGVPGMTAVGGEGQLKKLPAGEIQVVVRSGTEVVVT